MVSSNPAMLVGEKLIYLQLQKTGSTRITDLIQATVGAEERHKHDRVHREDLEDAMVEARTHAFRQSPRYAVWLGETKHLEDEIARASAEIAHLETAFNAAKARFEGLEKALRQANIAYQNPCEELIKVLERDHLPVRQLGSKQG